MSLAEGSRLGHYEILSLIGAGGMGEVYRARDDRLGREIAVKILREGASEDHLLRFEQEARAASALDHPSIIHIYEIGEHGGKPFIAMEYARGPTLRMLLLEAPLPPKKILSIGTQIAEGLAKAHGAGIIHRDLKPENLIVTPDGFVKILDFGLAKLFPGLEADASASATTVGIHTRSGLVPGTVGYTSPEQASGRAVDFRADQFCLGLILYETATGKRAFLGNSAPETLTAIIREEPEPISALNPRLPPPLRWIIERCLAKDPNDRYASTSDLARDLRDVQERLTELSSSGDNFSGPRFLSGAPRSRRTTWVGLTLAGALLGLAAVAGIVRLLPEANVEDAPLDRRLRLLVSTEDQAYDADLSPDGKMVAYVAEVEGQFDLFVGRVAGGARVRLTNDVAREADPDFSPDGETVAFARQLPSERLPEIGVIPSLGGEFRLVTRAAGMPAWSPDGRRLVAVHERADGSKVLITVTAAGTDRRELLDGNAQYPALYSPAWSPDGRTVVVRRSAGGVSGEIWTVGASGGQPKRLWEDPPGVFSHSPVFEPDGTRIVHSSNRAGATNLWSASVDGRDPPMRLTTGTGPDEYPSVADDGSVAFLNSHWRSALVLHDLESGATEELLTDVSYLWAPAFSPDGRVIAFSRAERDGSWHIWTIPVEGGDARQLSSGRLPEIYPRFTPDGTSVIFFTWSGETDRMWRSPLAGGPPQPLTSGEVEETYGDVSPDGRFIAYAQSKDDETRIRVAPLEGGEGRDIGSSPSTLPRWSPDGRFLAFTRDRSYASGILLVRADGSEERRLSDTGGWPVWLPDGEHVAYLVIGPGATQQICVVPVEGGECEPIRSMTYTGTNYPIDFSPDGRLLATSNGTHLYDEIWLLEASGAE